MCRIWSQPPPSDRITTTITNHHRTKSNRTPNFLLKRHRKMLPLSLLNATQGQPLMVELKSGETLNGHLVNCDTWMNLTMKEVIQTSADGEKFLKMPEMYVRGNIIKYLRVPEEILDHIKEDRQNRNMERNNQRFNQRSGGYRNNRQGGNRQGNRYNDRNRNDGRRFNNNNSGGGGGGNRDRY